MAKMFEVRRAIYVPASGGHPPNTEYRVAWGIEKWEKPTPVTKIQMVYEGKAAGRLSPSYPDDTLDEKAVVYALKLLKEGVGTSIKKSKIILFPMIIDKNESIQRYTREAKNKIVKINKDIYGNSSNSSNSAVLSIKLTDQFEIGNSLFGFLFHVEIA